MGKSDITSDTILSIQPLMTVQDVAAYLQLTPETVRRMVRQGELPAIKVNHSYRFRRSMIDEYLHRRTLIGEHEHKGG